MHNINQKIAKEYWHKKTSKIVHQTENYSEVTSTDHIIVDASELSYFYDLTRESTIAEYTLLIALYNMLLQRYFDDNAIAIGSDIIVDSKPLMGFYVFESIENKTIKEFLQITKEEVQTVYKYINYSEDHSIFSNPSVNYIPFQFNYGVPKESKDIAFGVLFNIEKDRNKNLKISLQFSNNFADSIIAFHFLTRFRDWLLKLKENINVPISEIPLVSDLEKEKLLSQFNFENFDFTNEISLAEIVGKQANKTPLSIAVTFKNSALNFSELNEQVNQFSDYLKKKYGILKGDFVGIKIERSEKLLIAILGILKSGAVYVPIDVNYPSDRIEYIENDSNCKLVINAEIYALFLNDQKEYSKENIRVSIAANDPAYIIYTSGTTGKPKGVIITNKNAAALINWAQQEFDSETFDVVLAATSHCFDLSVYEMFYTLSVGKTVKILNNALEIEAELPKNKRILLNTVPSSMRHILENGSSLENITVINLAGEPFPVDIAKKLVLTKAEIRNLYGPSEDTTYSTCYRLSSENSYNSAIPIGKPIANTLAYILDKNLELVPEGVIGKLYLSGDGVANGYLNQPLLTETKFIDNPFVKGLKMYDTGDLAKWMPDGNLAFFGRKDHQIKLRGYRIELSEIENAVLSFSTAIKQAVVAVKKKNNEDVLVAYYTESKVVEKAGLRSYLEKQLPAYMIPSYFMKVESIPLTPNGKVDKDAFPEITDTIISRKEYSAPTDDIEKILVEIWEQTLGISPIGIKDHFFELGGHSLMISQIINLIYKKLQKSVPYKLLYTNPSISDLKKALKNQEYLPIQQAKFRSSYPLTSSQQRLWILSQLEGGSLAYNMPFVVKLTGNIDIYKFKESFRLLIKRHDSLRTYFKLNESGEVNQFIQSAVSFEFNIKEEDFSLIKNNEEFIKSYFTEQSNIAFDLEKVPLVKAILVKRKKEEYLFFLSMHHIIGDGWSMELLVSEVVSIYNALIAGAPIVLPDLNIQYKDYANWLTEEKQQEANLASEKFWLKQFEGEIPLLDLPSFKKRPLIQTYNGETIDHQFSKDFLNKLKAFSTENEATLFMTLLSGIKSLLYKYTDQQDIIVGTAIAGRDHPDLENQIGLYLNTIAIRTHFQEKNNFSEIVKREKDTLLQAYDHQNYPFYDLIGKLNLKRDRSRSALFDVMVVLQNQRQLKNLVNQEELSELKIENYPFNSNASQFDLSYAFTENNEGLLLNIQYNTDVYDSFLIERMFSHFEILMTEAIKFPNQNIEEIIYITPQENNLVTEKFNDTKVDYPKKKTIVDLFEEQAALTPNHLAVVFENQKITYQELNEQSNRLANYLRNNYKIQPNDLVGIKLDRSERMIVVILAILKSGGAYVPIDTNYPQERIEYIENDSKAKTLIDSGFLMQYDNVANDFRASNLAQINQESDLAYIIYTSGTTGNPKGVMIEHKNAVELIHWSKGEYDLNKFDIVYAVTSYCFDLSVYEFFFTLSTGKTLRVLKNALEIARYADSDQKILLNTVPSVVRKLLTDKVSLENIKIINLAGEALSPDIINELPIESIEVRNLYGPSEDTTYSTCYLINSKNEKSISIGSPLSNTQIWILDDFLSPVPVGVLGNIYISGNGLARGYLNKPELTAEKFIVNPFIQGAKMYDTGDLGYWLTDGNIEFAKRKDDQVKVRGFRIELGEIKSAISTFSELIRDVVVLVQEDNEEKVIVAYYVTDGEVEKSAIRNYLGSKLPEYMIPNYYIELGAFPLTPNGKLDKKAFPGISEKDIIHKEYIAPKNETERQLVEIWQEVLNVNKIGITDDFFQLGGHSLKAMELLSIIHKRFDLTIKLDALFTAPTIENLAVTIENTKWLQEVNDDQSINQLII
ncbi:non-ribosomal peptide synthetase [Flavobacterium branchiicola]|uniref:Non-ribosomal peptide synthetase n=1 Tax=Flavobacterium branchiicola TaxID=1114875 RepID=A0ABV9PK15_9FLAO|nr:non-ribosomal peptide synthetase [Flavobacterium branchiicola]MBS7256337.1 amino acid adenylation domain-containing protein [Flavobacterium branchiicola]